MDPTIIEPELSPVDPLVQVQPDGKHVMNGEKDEPKPKKIRSFRNFRKGRNGEAVVKSKT